MRILFLSLSMLLVAACEKKEAPAPAPAPSASVVTIASAMKPVKLEKVEVPEVRIKDDAETTVKVMWQIPAGTAINDDAPFHVRWNRSDGLAEAPPDAKSTGSAVKDGYSVKVRPMKGAPNPTLAGEIGLVVCDAVNHSICLPIRRQVELGFVAAKDAATEIKVELPLPSAH